MSRHTIQAIRAIAESVARDERTDLEVTAVMPGGCAEVLVTRRVPGDRPAQIVIGIARDLSEADLRRAFSDRLRAQV